MKGKISISIRNRHIAFKFELGYLMDANMDSILNVMKN